MRLSHLAIRYGALCNLKCKFCAGYTPYFSFEQREAVDAVQTINDIQKIASVCEGIDILNVSGGEALLNKGIDELLIALLELPKVDSFYVVTNGSYIPRSGLLEILALHKDRVTVEISGYASLDLPREDLLHELKQYGIPFHVRDGQKWYDVSDVSRDELSLDQLKSKYRECFKIGHFWNYANGYLTYDCCRSNLMFFLNKYDECPGEWIKVSETTTENLLEKMYHLEKLDYSNICRYCRGIYHNSKTITPASEQLESYTRIR